MQIREVGAEGIKPALKSLSSFRLKADVLSGCQHAQVARTTGTKLAFNLTRPASTNATKAECRQGCALQPAAVGFVYILRTIQQRSLPWQQ
jgi:hypothetical protein